MMMMMMMILQMKKPEAVRGQVTQKHVEKPEFNTDNLILYDNIVFLAFNH